jgi:phage baseplate assembly protein V
MNSISTLPEMIVELDGASAEAAQMRALEEVRVQQRLSLPSLCELTFADPSGSFEAIAPGLSLRVAVDRERLTLFAGEVTAVEHEYGPSGVRRLRVRAYDLLHKLRKRQPVRPHVEVTLADLAREMVLDLGLSVSASETGPVWQRLIQHSQSDFDFLVGVAERCGLYFTLRDDVLHLLTLGGTGQAVPLTLGESLMEARVEINSGASCRKVSAIGWDPSRVEPHNGDAKTGRVGREVASLRVSSAGELMLVNEVLRDDRQAEAIAQAELDVRAAQEVTLWGVAEGDVRLRPGAIVKVEGELAPLGGSHVLTSVTHTIDVDRGFVSEISTTPPLPRLRASSAVAALGLVTRVDDPEDLGRVQVSLPAFGNVESDWIGVLAAGAGAGKGFIALPAPGDQVLVLLPRGDPAQGVVLGGLYGNRKPPDWGIDGGTVKRYTLLTPGGQRVRLDDAGESVRLDNSDGSYVELSPERVVLHARADLKIEAPGRSILIRGQAIDFERA